MSETTPSGASQLIADLVLMTLSIHTWSKEVGKLSIRVNNQKESALRICSNHVIPAIYESLCGESSLEIPFRGDGRHVVLTFSEELVGWSPHTFFHRFEGRLRDRQTKLRLPWSILVLTEGPREDIAKRAKS
jgi:hypothetical protein